MMVGRYDMNMVEFLGELGLPDHCSICGHRMRVDESYVGHMWNKHQDILRKYDHEKMIRFQIACEKYFMYGDKACPIMKMSVNGINRDKPRTRVS